MQIQGKHYRTIWLDENPEVVKIIDQTKLPFQFQIMSMRSHQDAAHAISAMLVRGAGLIGATAGFGMYLAALEARQAPDFMGFLRSAGETLKKTRPTAVNLAWAVDRVLKATEKTEDKVVEALHVAKQIADEDAEWCRSIGQHGMTVIRKIAEAKKDTINILTHCNAGWLAFVDYGSATAPIYAAHDEGIPVHVWVDETRPRNQGARLTAWELAQHGVPHSVIADNVGGHLMQHGMVDLVITGTDRTTHTGDVANKIGTYLKALAAHDNNVPFYVALPSSTFDWSIRDGILEIPIEQRGGEELTHMEGIDENGILRNVRIVPEESSAANYAFDVTPARLVTGLITERGVCDASEPAIRSLFPDKP